MSWENSRSQNCFQLEQTDIRKGWTGEVLQAIVAEAV